MKRIKISGFHAAVTALLVMVCGCDGGGGEEGMPKDTTPVVPLDSISTSMKPGVPGPGKAGEKPALTPEKKQ